MDLLIAPLLLLAITKLASKGLDAAVHKQRVENALKHDPDLQVKKMVIALTPAQQAYLTQIGAMPVINHGAKIGGSMAYLHSIGAMDVPALDKP